MEKNFKRMLFVVLGIFLMLSIILSACGGNDTSSTNSKNSDKGTSNSSVQETKDQSGQKKVELRFMIWDVNQKPAYEQSIKEFEEQNPNIKVNIEVNGWTQYWQKIQTEMAGGSAPDVFWNQIRYFPTFIEKETIVDLTPFIKRDNIDLSVYDETILKVFQKDGKVYGIPKDWDTIAIFYNKELFDKAGVLYPDENLTWDPETGGSFLELTKSVTLDKNGRSAAEPGFDISNIEQYGFVVVNDPQTLYWNFMLMNGGGFQAEPWSDEFLYDKPETIAAMKFLVDLIHVHHVAPEIGQVETIGGTELFTTGKVAMISDGSWRIRYYSESCPFEYGITMLPKGPKGRYSIVNGLVESIYSDTENIEEAWQLVKWFASQRNHEIFATTGTTFPAYKSEISKFVEAWNKKGVDVSAFVKAFEGNTALSAMALNWNQITASIDKNYSLMFLNEIDPEEAAKNIMEDIKAIQRK